ncbi:unnamed protein product [Danaus chrysippus]|uniref:(African queen) hypothetical protein n=1 Tax=Danaus chrysippus TaxID=151541 RepID=A0A8J2R1T1_9NEOP|nr:unnamed protein product [Danaus chrysippus]
MDSSGDSARERSPVAGRWSRFTFTVVSAGAGGDRRRGARARARARLDAGRRPAGKRHRAIQNAPCLHRCAPNGVASLPFAFRFVLVT